MSSENVSYRDRTITTATKGTPCGWWAYGETGTRLTCKSGYRAAHVLLTTLPVAEAGTALCAVHSPFDLTDAEREILDMPFQTMGEAGAARRAARLAAEGGVSGIDVLTELLTIPTPQAARVIKFHKLSAPMIGVIAEVARSRGLVGAWAMRNVIVKGVKGATMRTVTALINRGILADEFNDGDQSGTGGLCDYVLTERGIEIAEVIGCPVLHLPTDPDVIAALVGIHDQDDCATGCEVIIARGMALIPAGGDVCYGCGSVFTRPSGQIHPSIDVISLAVVSRNQSKGS